MTTRACNLKRWLAKRETLCRYQSEQRVGEIMSEDTIYKGGCFCGAVKFEVTGRPAAMGYCHCESCRHWSAGPVNAFSLWPAQALRVTQGADSIGSYSKTPTSLRKWCKLCGGHLCGTPAAAGIQSSSACPLSGKRASDPGWQAENEGSATGDGGLGHCVAGLTMPESSAGAQQAPRTD